MCYRVNHLRTIHDLHGTNTLTVVKVHYIKDPQLSYFVDDQILPSTRCINYIPLAWYSSIGTNQANDDHVGIASDIVSPYIILTMIPYLIVQE